MMPPVNFGPLLTFVNAFQFFYSNFKEYSFANKELLFNKSLIPLNSPIYLCHILNSIVVKDH